jgi:hypothetical protein
MARALGFTVSVGLTGSPVTGSPVTGSPLPWSWRGLGHGSGGREGELPEAVVTWVRAFDRGEAVQPFSFEIEVPDGGAPA